VHDQVDTAGHRRDDEAVPDVLPGQQRQGAELDDRLASGVRVDRAHARQPAVEGDQQIQALLLAHLAHQQAIGGRADRGFCKFRPVPVTPSDVHYEVLRIRPSEPAIGVVAEPDTDRDSLDDHLRSKMPETQTAASGTLRIHRHNENQQCGSRSTSHKRTVDKAVLGPTATCKCGQLLLLAGNAVTISVTEGVGAVKLLRDDKVCYWSGAASDVVDGSWSTNTVRVDGVHVRAVREHLGGWGRGRWDRRAGGGLVGCCFRRGGLVSSSFRGSRPGGRPSRRRGPIRSSFRRSGLVGCFFGRSGLVSSSFCGWWTA